MQKSVNFVNDYRWQKMALSCCEKLSVLFREIIPNNNVDFYCVNCYHSYSTKNKLEKHKKRNDHDHCYVEIPNSNSKILKNNQGEKSMKVPSIIYANLECLPKKCTHVKVILKNFTQKKNYAYTFWLFSVYKLFI